jgi:hypothetical protein
VKAIKLDYRCPDEHVGLVVDPIDDRIVSLALHRHFDETIGWDVEIAWLEC